jgi:hypothetical protein
MVDLVQRRVVSEWLRQARENGECALATVEGVKAQTRK